MLKNYIQNTNFDIYFSDFCFIGHHSVVIRDGATLLACLVLVVIITVLFILSRYLSSKKETAV